MAQPEAFAPKTIQVSGLSVKALERIIGKSNRDCEVLNRVRPLGLAMIRRRHRKLNIPAEMLIGETVTV